MKWIIILALIAIIATLAGAGAAMLKKRPGLSAAKPTQGDPRMARALALRVALSVALFLLVLFAWWMGWITPRGVPLGS